MRVEISSIRQPQGRSVRDWGAVAVLRLLFLSEFLRFRVQGSRAQAHAEPDLVILIAVSSTGITFLL